MVCSNFKKTLSIDQSTISHNSAGDNGGGIYFDGLDFFENFDRCHGSNYPSGADIEIAHATIADNFVFNNGAKGAGLFADLYDQSTLILKGSILASNRNGSNVVDDFFIPSDQLHKALFTDSLISETLPGNLTTERVHVTADPRLGPLVRNGGYTPTRLPLPGSPAIDSGNPESREGDFFGTPLADQRGLPWFRVVGDQIDIGAVETQSPAADFDSDGDVDGADFLVLQRNYGTIDASQDDGDVNGDTIVNSSDIALWKVSFGVATIPIDSADMDADNNIDGADFLAWQRGYGTLYDANNLQNWTDTYGNTATSPSAMQSNIADVSEPLSAVTPVSIVKVDNAQLIYIALAWALAKQPAEDVASIVVEKSAPVEVVSDLAFSSVEFFPTVIADLMDSFADSERALEPNESPWLDEKLLEKVFA